MHNLEMPIHPGEQLDHYRIDGVVSHSRVCITFRATDLLTNQEVIIHVPHADMEADPTFADRFRREQEIGKLLDHPGVTKVVTDDNRTRSYMVTEWFDGKALRQILAEEGRLAPERAVRIASLVCAALEYIHNHGVVHRDLEPENILVDSRNDIKLIHFAAAAKEGARRITFTSLSQVVGTSVYISPEELRGKRTDSRSDIYSLGVILYEMLTGTTPFQGVEPSARIASHPVPPREINPAISPQLQEVIYRAIEPEPHHRYANAHDFARDLEHLDQVGVADRVELRDWNKARTPGLRKILFYAAIALVPILIFGVLLYFSRR